MSDTEKNQQGEQPQERKKMSLAEAMKQKLEAQKQQQGKGVSSTNNHQGNKKMKSQQTKKSTMHRRTGGA
ncbi:hypothetical protein HYG86_07645 [Alkalicella caledoniensis]|uniref:Uncharacterized protein n=1 Tax=Alkalicella caledoniensis TaxID=2731377 RepID=A0A7G9W7K7_ALKCA|nr:hypothetical protein [Alkalicella caledoniensis]QNO14669.1 hypothetical protein HYG86_07645 [Alkalicella caledoniensis]